MASPNPSAFLSTTRAFMNTAILNAGGWKTVPQTKTLQRIASPLNRQPWTEHMRIHLKPRGNISEACADVLEQLLSEYTFLFSDGSLAHTQATEKHRAMNYKMRTETEALESLKARDLRVWKASQPFDDTSPTAIPLEVSSGHVLAKTASPGLRAIPSEETHNVTLEEKKQFFQQRLPRPLRQCPAKQSRISNSTRKKRSLSSKKCSVQLSESDSRYYGMSTKNYRSRFRLINAVSNTMQSCRPIKTCANVQRHLRNNIFVSC